MKDRNANLERLFNAARSAPLPELPAQMPDRLKTRVLAHWRAATAEAERTSRSIAALFRTALACAALATLLCVAWSSADLSPEPRNEEDLANYELRVELTQ